jgi:hypothetical protein
VFISEGALIEIHSEASYLKIMLFVEERKVRSGVFVVKEKRLRLWKCKLSDKEGCVCSSGIIVGEGGSVLLEYFECMNIVEIGDGNFRITNLITKDTLVVRNNYYKYREDGYPLFYTEITEFTINYIEYEISLSTGKIIKDKISFDFPCSGSVPYGVIEK